MLVTETFQFWGLSIYLSLRWPLQCYIVPNSSQKLSLSSLGMRPRLDCLICLASRVGYQRVLEYWKNIWGCFSYSQWVHWSKAPKDFRQEQSCSGVTHLQKHFTGKELEFMLTFIFFISRHFRGKVSMKWCEILQLPLKFIPFVLFFPSMDLAQIKHSLFYLGS